MPSADPQETIAAARRRLADLQTYQLPRLRDCRGPVDLQRELSAELKEDIRRVKRSIDAVDTAAYEQQTERERESYLSICKELSQELDAVHRTYREALLESTRNIKTASTQQYELVPEKTPEIAGTPVSGQGQDDALQTKTNEVTDALRRTAATMRAELERSVMATQLLDESTQTLRSTSSLYDTYSNLLTTSTRLVKQLERADWYDKLIIFLALGLFFLVVAFIIKRRVLDKAVRGVGWWVGGSYKLLTGKGSSGKGGKLSGKVVEGAVNKGKQAVQVVSTYASSVSSILPTAAEVTDIVAVATTAVTLPADARIRNEL
ncbi:hypothetical protein QFC21_003363 [Naganishia friedmannii]|uniref:Uncharacterized protein n=1 Tax=Naganishia friedmannii TaxID=89922 RepID=A0ACC2VQI3_9TREE|nr:hypothetical protein QFC21_003363 [Naganishia friedmannii]